MSGTTAEAIVLAGGLGTRLRPVVSDLPKPMAPVNGRPFLEWLLEYWIDQGIRRFIISVGYLPERIVAHFGDQWRGAEIAYAQESEPLGTGGALLLAAKQVRGGTVLVLNGDTFFAVDLKRLAQCHADFLADCTLSLFRSQDTQRYMGLKLAPDGRVADFASLSGGLANGGVYLMQTAWLRGLPRPTGQPISLESEIFPQAEKQGWKIYGREWEGAFIDIGVPRDYRRAAELLGRQIAG